jgi:hypothetical protein
MLRKKSVRIWKESTSRRQAKECFIYDAAKLWNSPPKEIKMSTSLTMAKKALKSYSKTLPI